jgi:hypothetical protein
MEHDAERMHILEMIESGQITAAEGLRLLEALNEAEGDDLEAAAGMEMDTALEPLAPPVPPQPPIAPGANAPAAPGTAYVYLEPEADEPEVVVENRGASAELPADAARWKHYRTVPLWIGVGLTVIGSLLMYAAIRPDGTLSLWMVCAAAPMLLGVLVLAWAWAGRTAPWLHLRVQQPPGASPQRIALSFPLPIRPAVWLLRTFGRNIPNVQDQRLDEMLLAVGRAATPENPIYIQVDEGARGEKVEIYIG